MKNLYIFIAALFISTSLFSQNSHKMTTGDGTFENPYDVATAIANNAGIDAWVTGFIVGNIEVGEGNLPNLAHFTAPFTTPHNVYIAASASETDTTAMLIVKLAAVKSDINLVDHPENLGNEIKFRGDLQAYFGVAGMKNTDGYWMNGTGINPEAPANIVVIGTSTTVPSLNATFDDAVSNQDYTSEGWLNINKLGERHWIGKEFGESKYIQCSGYNATYSNLESWIITPGVNLTSAHTASFDAKVGYWKHAGLTVYVSTDFDGQNQNIFSSTWNDITPSNLPTEPTNGYSDDFTTFNLDLSAYTGHTVYIMFKYEGNNSTNTTTFQIDNVLISDNVKVNKIDASELELSLYPNPTSGSIKIEYQVEQKSNVDVSIFSLNGELLETIFSGKQTANNQSLNWTNSTLNAGTYIIKVKTNNSVKVTKLILL